MTHTGREKLWTGQFILILTANFTALMVNALLLVSIPLYLRAMGASNTAAGLSTGLYSLAAMTLRPIVGHFLDYRGRIRLMRGGLIPMIVGIILSNFTDAVPLHLALRVLEGIGFSVVSTAGATIVSDLVPESRITEGIGYNGAVATLTNAVGPLVGLVLIDGFGFAVLFTCLIPMSLLPLAVSLFLKESVNPSAASGERTGLKHLFDLEKGALPASAMMIFSAVSYGAVVTFLAAFGMERGVENMQFFFVLFPCTVVVSRFFSGRLIDGYGYLPVVVPSLIIGASSLVLIFFARTVAMFSLVAVLYGLGYGILMPAFNALAVRNSSPNRRGAANATFYIALDLGIGGGAIFLGLFSNCWGLASTFLISAFFMIFSFALFPFLERKRR